MRYIKLLNSVRNTLRTRDWWKGVVGNLLSTMVGILLTIGVGAFVEYFTDKQLARDMMFNVLTTTEENCEVVEEYDSIFTTQVECIDSLVSFYNRNNGCLDNIPAETLQSYLDSLTILTLLVHMDPEVYINNSQTIHQIGDAGLYKEFHEFIQLDKRTFADIDDILAEWRKCTSAIISKEAVGDPPVSKVVKELIESKVLTDYEVRIKEALLSLEVKLYKAYHTELLKEMDATQEEYEEYLQKDCDAENDSIFDFEDEY